MNSINKALWAVLACYSWRGHDFGERPSGTESRRWAKKVTRRAHRRLSKTLARDDR